MSSTSTLLVDSPKSIFGFEPIHGATPCGHQLRTQRSLLAELLQATASGANEMMPEEDEDNDFEDSRACLPVPTLRPVWCTCNMGHCVPREFHTRECAMSLSESQVASELNNVPQTSPIAIPTKTYYKTNKQIEERQRLQYQRQVYRVQQEAQEQLLARQA